MVLFDERGWRQLFVGEGDPEDEGWVDLTRLASLWVIADDRGAEAIELTPDDGGADGDSQEAPEVDEAKVEPEEPAAQ